MAAKVLRKIIHIDESKCNGCGICLTSCAEGALALVNGKARLVKEKYCDGLAACLKECPQGALSIVEREAEEFDEEATREHLRDMETREKAAACACPGNAVRQFEKVPETEKREESASLESELTHWPVQLTLVPPGAPFLKNADVVLLADCVPVAYPNLHRDFLRGHAALVACPKLDDLEAHLDKLTAILKQTDIKSLTVVRMEVPCCAGLTFIARKAVDASGKNVPLREVVISIGGKVKSAAAAV